MLYFYTYNRPIPNWPDISALCKTREHKTRVGYAVSSASLSIRKPIPELKFPILIRQRKQAPYTHKTCAALQPFHLCSNFNYHNDNGLISHFTSCTHCSSLATEPYRPKTQRLSPRTTNSPHPWQPTPDPKGEASYTIRKMGSSVWSGILAHTRDESHDCPKHGRCYQRACG